jgi:hypothetical protein
MCCFCLCFARCKQQQLPKQQQWTLLNVPRMPHHIGLLCSKHCASADVAQPYRQPLAMLQWQERLPLTSDYMITYAHAAFFVHIRLHDTLCACCLFVSIAGAAGRASGARSHAALAGAAAADSAAA